MIIFDKNRQYNIYNICVCVCVCVCVRESKYVCGSVWVAVGVCGYEV